MWISSNSQKVDFQTWFTFSKMNVTNPKMIFWDECVVIKILLLSNSSKFELFFSHNMPWMFWLRVAQEFKVWDNKKYSNTACLLMDIYTVRQKGKETVMKPTIFGNDFQVFAAQILSWLAHTGPMGWHYPYEM